MEIKPFRSLHPNTFDMLKGGYLILTLLTHSLSSMLKPDGNLCIAITLIYFAISKINLLKHALVKYVKYSRKWVSQFLLTVTHTFILLKR